jgi:3-hydroxyacyl-[acyl-carrier-protein] dehydratase
MGFLWGVKSVKDYIPHRDPFLFVDRIVAFDEARILTEWDIRPDFAVFEGHYPGQPILPGVLLCESVFQSAGVFMAMRAEQGVLDVAGGVPILSKIGQARFKRMVKPGETLRIEVVPLEQQGPFHLMRGKVSNANAELVMNVEFTITLK